MFPILYSKWKKLKYIIKIVIYIPTLYVPITYYKKLKNKLNLSQKIRKNMIYILKNLEIKIYRYTNYLPINFPISHPFPITKKSKKIHPIYSPKKVEKQKKIIYPQKNRKKKTQFTQKK